MKKLLILLTVLLLLSACGANTDKPQGDANGAAGQVDLSGQTPSSDKDTPEKETSAQTATGANAPSENVTEPEQPKEVFPLATFIELGAESCIPCKMMQPILKEIREEYQGLVKVEFIDLYKDRAASQKYSVRMMPTQVFLDMDGREFFRHEGFYPKEEIEKMLAEKIGITKPKK
jgi:thioredoxin 1